MLYRQFATQAEIDQQYNVEHSVPDMGAYVDFFVGESAKARDALECVLDVPYGPTVEETLDIFPAADPRAPILVFIHGGYWRSLSSKEFDLVARGPVARGITVVVTNYALCPKVDIGEITRQNRAAVARIRSTGMSFNGDRERIYVAGHSAGGQQVGMLLSTPWERDYGLPGDVIKGGFAISGLFDLGPLRYSFLQPMLQLTADTVRTQSPLFLVPERAPPLLVSVGGEESAEFHRQSADYLAAWTAAGLEGADFPQPGTNHFTAIEGFVDPGSALCERLQSFVDR